MEMKVDAKTERVRIWEELLKVARPDSKFSWQFSEFICDYEGSEKGTALLTATDMYKNAKVIFITPDNNLETLREQAFRDKKTVVMTNYGITRGFFLIRPGQIPEGKEEVASLLDGVSRYWKHRHDGHRCFRHHPQWHPLRQGSRLLRPGVGHALQQGHRGQQHRHHRCGP